MNEIRRLVAHIRPTWPLPVKFVAGGANGRVFETNDGRYMKFVMDVAPQEWKSLLKLQGTHVVPRVVKGEHINFAVNPKNKLRLSRMFNIPLKKAGNGLTMFIMTRVGNGKAMTLNKYMKQFPDANKARIQRRIFQIISNLHLRRISHGNLHPGNILVTADSAGRITGMWVIDFGRSKNIPLGKTEREMYANMPINYVFNTPSLFSENYGKIPVRNESRANVHMAKIVYNKNYIRPLENATKRLSSEIAKNMKNYKSPNKKRLFVKSHSASKSPSRRSPSTQTRSVRARSAPHSRSAPR